MISSPSVVATRRRSPRVVVSRYQLFATYKRGVYPFCVRSPSSTFTNAVTVDPLEPNSIRCTTSGIPTSFLTARDVISGNKSSFEIGGFIT
jgi:hypothetical protein